MSVKLNETPGYKRPLSSKCDQFPEDIKEQLIEAWRNRTHSIPDMVRWLNQPDFNDEYSFVTKAMLRHWLDRRGYRD
jgi:hypothetical protein